MKTGSCRPETVGGSLVPATDGSRRPEPSFFRVEPEPEPSPRFIKPKLRLKLGSFSSRAEPELSFFRAEPEPSSSSLARYQPYIRLEFSLTPSNMHLAMNENHFQTKVFVFNRGQPFDINSQQTPIIYFVDNPPMNINWADSDD